MTHRSDPLELVKAFGTLSAAARQEPDRAVQFDAADDATAGEMVADLIRVGDYGPVRVGGLNTSIRIGVFGDLHSRVPEAGRRRHQAAPGHRRAVCRVG